MYNRNNPLATRNMRRNVNRAYLGQAFDSVVEHDADTWIDQGPSYDVTDACALQCLQERLRTGASRADNWYVRGADLAAWAAL